MDKSIFFFLNRFSGRLGLVDFLMIFVSNRVRYIYLFVLIYMWFKSHKTNLAAKKAITAATLSWLVKIITNIIFFRPRPFVSNRVGILIPSKTDSTLLSKHTVLAVSISFSIFLYQRFWGSILLGLSVLTGFSRIWVGHHYPSDILRSTFVGVLISLIVEKTFPLREFLYKKFMVTLKDWLC